VRLERPWERLARALGRATPARLVPLSLLGGVALSVVLGAGVAEAIGEPPDTMPIDAVKPGMKGYGLTVFKGTTPEKFDVEIIATLKNFKANQDLFLIKTPHPRLEITKTVAGMSGSPIYLNGKMIGAYAYGWIFGSEAVAGVTPIKSMLEELARPIPPGLLPRAGSPIVASASAPRMGLRGARSFEGAPGAYDLAAHARQIASRSEPLFAAPTGAQLARATTPLVLGGMSPSALRLANELFAPLGMDAVQGGGSGGADDPSAPTRYVDGGAIGVELVKGDISAMGLGTVTRVSGDKLVAFGHPMLGGGIESLPTAIAKVHWIMATLNRSFKIGEAARSMGALVNDRQAAIVVDSSVRAPTFPMSVHIEGAHGAPKTTWNVRVAADQFMAPGFVAMALGSALESSVAERKDLTYRVESRVKIAKYGTIVLEDFGAGNGTPISPDDFGRGRLARGVGALLNNPWEPVDIESVESTARISLAQDVYRLRGAKVLEPEIDAGAPVRIRVDLEPYMGKMEQRTIEVKVPLELAGREVDIELTPGFDVERPLPTPDSVAELVAVLPIQTYEPQSLVASFRLRGEAGAAFKGKLATRLPPGALDVLRPTSESDAPETFAAVVNVAVPMKKFVVGHDSVSVRIHPVLR
jgi:hypothetical protein